MRRLLLSAVLLTSLVPAHAEYVWLEAENTASRNVEPKVSGWGRKEFLSGEALAQVTIEAGKVDAELPAGGGLLSYQFNVGKAANYELWNRIGYEFARSPFDWQLDGGAWTRVEPTDLTTDLMELQTWNEIAWFRLGAADLKAGQHTLAIRLPKTTDKDGKPARVLYASDVILIHEGAFHPNGPYKPDQDWRTDQDKQAAAQVFKLADTPPGQRTTIALNGLWEAGRDDEQLPGEVAEPIGALPAHPFWRAIQVPGDKNKVRPDLVFCHRMWYRTKLDVPASLAGRSFFVEFPQNNLNTTVYVNGRLCGFEKSNFVRFRVDLTKAIKPGQVNELYVGIRDAWYGFSANPNNPMKLRRMFNFPVEREGQGFLDLAYPVWRHFQSGILVTPTLTVAGPAYVDDVFCQPSVAKQALTLDVTLHNPGGQATGVELLCEAVDGDGKVAKAFAKQTINLAAGAAETIKLTEPWADPELWWPDAPHLYQLRTTVSAGGRPVDIAHQTFGFREWSWAGTDFRLNGVKWHGWADVHNASSAAQWLADQRAFNQTMMRFWGTSWQGMPPDEALDFFDREGVVVRRSGILDGEAIGYHAMEQDPDLKAKYGTDINVKLLDNWRDQMVAQVKGERNHPSVMIWSIENEYLYINCLNLHRQHLPEFEAEVTKTSDAVMATDPTRPTMVDGGGATKANTLPVHGDHYVAGRPELYPDLAYEKNPTGGGRGYWEWDMQRPRFLGEDFYMTGNHPEVSYFEGDSAFAGKPKRGVAIWNRILQEGYRWAEHGAWHFWLTQSDADGTQYLANAPRAVFCRQHDWTFASGQQVQRTFGIFNDTHDDDPITFTWTLMLDGQRAATDSKEYRIAGGENQKFDVTIAMPQVPARQEGKLFLKLTVKGEEVFLDEKPLSVMPLTAAQGVGAQGVAFSGPAILVYDPHGSVSSFLKASGLPTQAIDSLEAIPDGRVLIVGSNALSGRDAGSSQLAAWAVAGRRVIVLDQDTPLRYQGLPAEMNTDQNGGQTAFVEDASHPLLRGLTSADFFTWGPGVKVYRNAYEKPTRGARSLLQCGDRLRYSALAECQVGSGLMLLCQLNLADQLGRNIVAQQVFQNLLDYARSYQQEFYPVRTALAGLTNVQHAVDGIGVETTAAKDVLDALAGTGPRTAIVAATPGNLKTLADNRPKVDAFCGEGGTLMLCGLTPEGLDDYNKLVGANHMIRKSKRERVLLPPVRDRLTAGLTAGDVALYSAQRIFSWTAGNYVVDDMFTYVVDHDEVASFGTSPFGSYDLITNGFVSADGWPLIINFPKNADDSPYDVPITLQKPQTITEFGWTGNTFYYPQTKVNLIFDGDTANMLKFDVEPNAEPQTFEIDPPRTATTITVQIAGWTPVPNKAPNIGIDLVTFKAQRPAEYVQHVKAMTNIGGLMHYERGKGGLVLCNLNFKDTEEVPENVSKKRHILATILRNLKAPFAGGKTIIAGAELAYAPLDISKQATAYRDDRGWFGDRQRTFKELPTGQQRLAGVPYMIYDFATSPVPTVLMLKGERVPHAEQLPESITGIPVGQQADALFFLQTCRLDRRRNPREVRDGKQFELVRYVIHYADGQTAEVPVLAEIDIDDYRQKQVPTLPGAQIAWTRPWEGTQDIATAYAMQWNNPRPEVAIESFDMVYGAERRGVPVLIAVTAAKAVE